MTTNNSSLTPGPIGVFDSGIGGMSTLNEIKKLLPNENYIYYADSKNNPYGERTDEQLTKLKEAHFKRIELSDAILVINILNFWVIRWFSKKVSLIPFLNKLKSKL